MKKQPRSRMHIFTSSNEMLMKKCFEVLNSVFSGERLEFELNNPFGKEDCWEIWAEECTDDKRLYACGICRGIYELKKAEA